MTAHDGEPPSRRRPKPIVNADDQALWEHVARTVPRPRRAKPRVPAFGAARNADDADDVLARLESRLMSAAAHTSNAGANGSPPVKIDTPTHHPTRARTPPLADFDRKAVRRIRSGRIEIEARLDLHGMRQDEAHGALRSFLHGCQGRGLRWVLVITGKGRVASADDAVHTAPVYAGHERGVLRRAVPRWLAEPDLRPLVVSYTTAALHHGGEGALYIQLRARRGSHHV